MVVSTTTPIVLIINADDFGYTTGINDAVVQAAKYGLLRSTTIMANGEAFEHAVDSLKRLHNIGVGIHLVLTELSPLAPQGYLPGLIGEDGLLPANPDILLRRIIKGKIRQEVIQKEIECQVSKVLDHGLRPTHLDSHKHVHAFPQVCTAVAEVARKYSIRWLRNPFESPSMWRFLHTVESCNRIIFCKQYVRGQLFSAFRRNFYRTIGQTGLRFPDRFLGISQTGVWSRDLMLKVLTGLRTGINELMLHPGVCDMTLLRMKTRLKEQREAELGILTSAALHEFAAEHGVIFRHFGEVLS